MLRQNLRLALRYFRRHTRYTLINMLGLALGFASCLALLFYVYDELTFDRFHSEADQIYRIHRQYQDVQASATVGYPVLPAIRDRFPEVETGTRVLDYWFEPVLSNGENGIHEEEALFVDEHFFEVFGFPLAQGKPEEVFDTPNAIVLSQSAARKYFGQTNPLGKTLVYNADEVFTVTGVLGPIPGNAHFDFEVLIKPADLSALIDMPGLEENWGLQAFITYVRVPPGTDLATLGEEITGFVNGLSELEGDHSLFPLVDIHLHSDVNGELGTNSSWQFVGLLLGICLIILLLAAINYTNLTTSIFNKRLKEVGIRKVVGAGRRQLVLQFLGESMLMAFGALLVAVVIVQLALPLLRAGTGRSMSLAWPELGILYGGALLIALLTGLLAGLYPSLFIAGRWRTPLLRSLQPAPSRTPLWKWLVVGQFALATLLLINTGMIVRQVAFMQNKSLGFDEERLVTIPVRDEGLTEKPALVKTTIAALPGVASVSSTTAYPGAKAPGTTFGADPERQTEPFKAQIYFVDEDYLPTIGVDFLVGRNFADASAAEENAIVLNERAAIAFGFRDPREALEETISFWGADRRVIGIVRDFHHASTRQPIEPIILTPDFDYCQGLVVKLRPGKLDDRIAELRTAWAGLSSTQPFAFRFLDEDIAQYYASERQFTKVLTGAALLSLLIACLGLLGLTAFAVERRTKEMGIRKVLGASVAAILGLFNREFLVLVLIAVVMALPLSWWVMQQWMSAFAYPAPVEPWIFAVAAVIVAALAILTITVQSWKTVIANPVDSLRSE